MAKKSSKKDANRGRDGKFVKGRSKTGGRNKGVKNHDGLQAVLNMLKGLISKEKNLKLLESKMQAALNANPLGFYYKYVMPLLPKNIVLESDEDNPINFIFNNVKRLPEGNKRK